LVFTKRIKNRLYEAVEYAWVWTLVQAEFLPSREAFGFVTVFTFYLPLYLLINFGFWVHSTVKSFYNRVRQILDLLFKGPVYRNLYKYCKEQDLHSHLLEEINIGLHYNNGRLEFFDIEKSFKEVEHSHSSLYRYTPHHVKWSQVKKLLISKRVVLLTSSLQTTREMIKFVNIK